MTQSRENSSPKSSEADFQDTLDYIVERDPRFKRDSYIFVLEALENTVRKRPQPGHVTGKELLYGIKDFANDKFGPMVRTVIDHWGVNETIDFGHIVYNLLDHKILSKTENDSLDDFKDIFEFDKAFGKLN